MEHVPPYGSTDPNAGYVDPDPATNTPGSMVPAAAIEHPMREIVNVIASAGLVPNGENLTQLKGAIDGMIAAAVAGLDIHVDAATETVAGIVELATAAEVQTGTDTARAVTPAGLASRTATAARAGIVELATTAEAAAGTDTTRAVTPAGLAAHSPAKLSTASGSAPSYSLRAWAVITGVTTTAILASENVTSVVDNGTGDTTINFATAMPDANYAILGMAQSPDTSGDKLVGQTSTAVNSTSQCRVMTRSYAGIVDCPRFYIGIVR